jgi:hypothetical protein
MKTREEKLEMVFEHCLEKMFKMVGEKYPNKELTDKDNWYRLRRWTELEEKIFKDWMVDYLRKKTRITKKKAMTETSFFLFNFGWTTCRKKIDKTDDGTLKVICQ